MKKSLAILMSAILLFSTLACGVALNTAAWSDDGDYASTLYWDFSNETSFNALKTADDIGVRGAALSYEDGAAKISYTNDCPVLWLRSNTLEKVPVNSYRYLAMKVKATSPTAKLWSTYTYASRSGVATADGYRPDYNGTTDWQLIIINLSAENLKDAAQGGEWSQFGIYMDEYWSTSQCSFYVEWAGLFASEDHAKAQYAASEAEESVDGLLSGLFFDISTQAKYDALVSEGALSVHGSGSTPTYGFDETNNALKITYSKTVGKNGTQVQLGNNGARLASATDCPILAMKVKLSGTYDVSGAWGKGPYFNYCVTGGNSSYNYNNATTGIYYFSDTPGAMPNAYNLNTTDWQLVLIDMSATRGTAANWTRMQLVLDKLAANTGNTGTSIWMQWAGMFRSAEEATLYYNYDDSSATPIINKTSRQTNSKKNALRFGFDVAISDFSGISYAAGNYATARKEANYMRELNHAKMKRGDELVDIVGFGALLSKSALTADEFIVGAASVKKTEAENLYSLDGDKLTYTVRVVNIPESNRDSRIYARSYVAYKDGDAITYVYGDIVSDSVNGSINENFFKYDVQTAANQLSNQGYTTQAVDVEYVQVAPYNAEYAFTHQQGMAFFKNRIYVSFSRGYAHEDYPGQEMVVVSSEDFANWSEPQVVGASRQSTHGKTTVITGCLYSSGEKLFAYYTEHDWGAEKFDNGVFNPGNPAGSDYKARKLVRWTEDGVNWSEPVDVIGTPHESPRQTAEGNWLSSWGAGMLYSDADVPDGISWRQVGLTSDQLQSAYSRGATMLGECSWYQTDDATINMVMRSDMVVNGEQIFKAWLSQSYDGGLTWTDAYPTNFQIDWQMVNFGRLPDGRFYFVGTISKGGRYPLVLLLSDDGYNFKEGYVLRNDTYTLQQEGWSKGGQYGYPEVMIHDGYLYVVCSRMKEVVELTRVKLSDIS